MILCISFQTRVFGLKWTILYRFEILKSFKVTTKGKRLLKKSAFKKKKCVGFFKCTQERIVCTEVLKTLLQTTQTLIVHYYKIHFEKLMVILDTFKSIAFWFFMCIFAVMVIESYFGNLLNLIYTFKHKNLLQNYFRSCLSQ